MPIITRSNLSNRTIRVSTLSFIFIVAYYTCYTLWDIHGFLNDYVLNAASQKQSEHMTRVKHGGQHMENNNNSIPASSSSVHVSFAASRLDRMTMYEERYKYLPPAPYTNHSRRDDVCGSSPDYTTFFSTAEWIRSVNKEDKTIYELFFKLDSSSSSTDNDNNDPGMAAAAVKGNVVEMGAYNGLQESNSHFFDICLGYNTLLVEGNPMLWEKVVVNRPNAHRFSYAPSCTEEETMANTTVKFDKYPMTNGGLADGSVQTAYSGRNWTVDVPCGSLTQVLLDVFPNGHVSFFSLDVEGAEPFVVGKALDFDRVFIEIIMIENRNNFCKKKCKSRDEFQKIMQDYGYAMFNTMVTKSDVFIHPLSKHLETAEKKGFVPA